VDLHLRGKISVVTGASKGIGLAVTKTFVAEGVQVVAGAQTRGAELSAMEADGHVVPVDLATPDGAGALIAGAAELGGLDILVNNAGAVTPRLDGFAAVTDEDWFASLTLTLMAAGAYDPRRVAAAHPAWRGIHRVR
jgi:NAD(P)-dependent dehydrogenase (short-subunit alcohol dehydrogenase family)